MPGKVNLDSQITGNIRPQAFDQSLFYTWNPPTTGVPDSYTLSVTSNSPITIAGSETSVLVTGLTNGQEYAANIVATTGGSTSDPAYFRTVQPGLPPSPPQNLSAVHLTSTTAQVYFTQPLSNGDATVKWFVVTTQSSDSNDPIIRKSAPGTYTSLVITGLNSNSTYEFLVQAVNDPGYSPYTSYAYYANLYTSYFWIDFADTRTYNVNTSNYIDSVTDKSASNYQLNQLPANSGQPIPFTSIFPSTGTPINGNNTAYFPAEAGIKMTTQLNGVTDFFWVGRQKAQGGHVTFFFGDDGSYDWHGTINQYILNDLSPGIYNASATIYYNGTSNTGIFSNISIVATDTVFLLSVHGITGSTQFQGLCYDRTYYAGWIGDLGEVICYNSALTNEQIVTIENYLRAKWNI